MHEIVQLVIQNFSLLGFNPLDYLVTDNTVTELTENVISESDNLFMGNLVFDESSFEKSNEILLIILLRFLIMKLHPDFIANSKYCWPILNVNIKNEMKKAIEKSFIYFFDSKILSYFESKVSILTVAKGKIVWKLLWKLSNAAIDAYLIENNGYDPDIDLTNIEQLKEKIESNKLELEEKVKLYEDSQNKKLEYMDELEERNEYTLNKIIEIKANLKSLSESENGKYLDAKAKIERSEIITRLNGTKIMLENLLVSIKQTFIKAYESQNPNKEREMVLKKQIFTKFKDIELLFSNKKNYMNVETYQLLISPLLSDIEADLNELLTFCT